MFRNAEEDDRGDAVRGNVARLGPEQVERQLCLAGHGLDRHAPAFAMAHEERQDEVRGRQGRLTDQRAECGI